MIHQWSVYIQIQIIQLQLFEFIMSLTINVVCEISSMFYSVMTSFQGNLLFVIFHMCLISKSGL